MLHLCQLYYLFVEKPKHATDVRNDGVIYLLHPLNNPLTTLKPQYSMKCETWQVITAMGGLFNFTMSQQTDRQDLSTHEIMICQRNNRQLCRLVTQTILTAHLLDYLAIIWRNWRRSKKHNWCNLLVACTRLYTPLCPSVRRSVGPSHFYFFYRFYFCKSFKVI